MSPWLVGGVWSVSMVALFLITVVGAVVVLTVTTSVSDPLLPAVMVPSFQVTLPPAWVPPMLAETKVTSGGS